MMKSFFKEGVPPTVALTHRLDTVSLTSPSALFVASWLSTAIHMQVKEATAKLHLDVIDGEEAWYKTSIPAEWQAHSRSCR
jgi:hypothetical protein